MKIYTEEHVRNAIELARYTHPEGRAYTQTEEYDYSDDEVVDLLIPIELPSNEEIQKESKFKSNQFNPALNIGWVEGAKWMRDKIQGGKQMSKQKTAVEQFIEQLEEQGHSWENASIKTIEISIKVEDYLKLKQAAKEMEKAQIVKANNNGCGSMMCMIDSKRDGEQYYEKTYGGNK